MMGKDMTSLFKLFGGIKCIQFYNPQIKKIWSVPVDQVKVLYRQVSTGVKVMDRYDDKRSFFNSLPSEVKHITFKNGRGGGSFFKHLDGKVEKITVHQLDAYLVYVIYKENERKFLEKIKKSEK
jgi:predicted 2-oxoglutarate/Fe(II)-dependent dioxygenase YbiX